MLAAVTETAQPPPPPRPQGKYLTKAGGHEPSGGSSQEPSGKFFRLLWVFVLSSQLWGEKGRGRILSMR